MTDAPAGAQRKTVAVVHDRGDRLVESPGIEARVRSLAAWVQASGVEASIVSIAPGASRRGRALSVLRPAARLAAGVPAADLVVLVGLNAPHMTLLALRLAGRRRVLLDVCDSTLDTARIALRSRIPLQVLKSLLQVVLVGAAALLRGVPVAYVAEKDRDHDRRLLRHRPRVLVPQVVDDALAGLGDYVGPPERIVVAADYSAYHNREGMRLLVDAVADGSLQLEVPVELYGPQAPDLALPDGVVYRGFVPQKTDIYRGQTAVFVPNLAEAGQQNKLLEALRAGRPVLAGQAVAVDLADGETVATYADADELRDQMRRLQVRRLPPGRRFPEPVGAVTPLIDLLGP